jgi:hypothetical protein
MVIGQIVLISMVLAARGPRAMSIPLVLLHASVAAYLIKSSPVLAGSLPVATIPLYVMATAAPFLVWACANILFDFEKPPLWVMVMFPSMTIIMCAFATFGREVPRIIEALSISDSLFVV